MKKVLTLLLIIVSLMALSLTAVAANDDYVGEKEFTVASFNGVRTFLNNGADHTKFEDAAYWLIEQKAAYNLKYVSILGSITGWPSYRYASVGGDDAKLVDLSLNDETWNKQHSRFAEALVGFKDVELPFGIAPGLYDYIPDGRRRDNLLAKYIPADSYMYESYTCEYLDEVNSYYVVENNGTKYMIFSLELWPRAGTLEWFIETVRANPDKYVIVFTNSFVDATGKMYTMWDWASGFKAEGTTSLKGYNLTNIDKARDGEGIWNYAFKQFDNILAVISANIKDAGGILTNKAVRDNGVETALIGANADNGRHSKAPSVLLTKFSPDNKTITVAWSGYPEGVDESTVKTITLNKIGELKEPTKNDSLPLIPVQYNGANKSYILGYEGNTFRPNANMTRAEACTIFARLLLGTQTIPDGYTTRFTDVKKGDWFYNAVAFLDETGYFFRNKNTTYKPNEPITRAEFVELANFTSSLTGNKGATFTDVPQDHFYYDSIVAAAKSGLVNGYEDNTFRPDNTITRAEVVTVINRLLGLKTSERTVDTTKLENEFVDIGTHWAKLNILMASNSNVHGAYYYNASLDGVKENSSSFIFENKHFAITVDKKTGKVTHIKNIETGEEKNIMGAASNPCFIYLTSMKGAAVLPTKLEKDGNRIKVTFRDKTVAYMIVDIHDDFMTFEIDSELPKTIKSVTFANVVISSSAAPGYHLNAIGMSAWTNPVNKGYRSVATSSIAHAYTIYDAGVMGAKLGITFSKNEDAIPFLQQITDNIDRSVGLASKAGGAYAQVYEGNHGDYAFCTNLDPENIDTTIALLKEMDVDQYDIHQSTGNTFSQGDFVFAHTESGTATEYYEKYGKKFEEAGIDTILHTYAYYIAPGSKNLLNDPKWHKDLELMPDVYTLSKDLSKTNRNIKTVEDASAIDLNAAFFRKTSKYVLIDEEIIMVKSASKAGLIDVTRGCLGTEPARHAAGTKIYHLSGYFSMLVPKLGSDLFYHIADLTAKAYNEGHFSMLYIDAIDGLSRHMPEGEEVWYYFHMFLHRIVSQCEKDPQVETSAGAPSEWNVRGRQGAWDYANYSIKKFTANHVAANKSSMTTNMKTTLGWFNFFTDGSTTLGLKNTMQKTMFRDDLDFVGMNAILYDMSMVYNPFSVSSINDNPFHKANILYYYNNYSKLRKDRYFSDEVIKKVEAIGGEWRVIEKDGKYVFEQRSYDYQNFGNAVGVADTLNGNNPFSTQAPFIRVESRYSTLGGAPYTMISFDETKAVGTANVVKTFTAVNMTTRGMVATVRIKGTGADGDAMLLSFAYGANGESDGRRDHFIDLNYEGWREFVLLDFDNADYDTTKYPFSGIGVTGSSYNTYRFTPAATAINRFTIRTVGNTAGNAMIDDIILQPHSDAPVKNPTVKVGNQSITFNCEISGGNYIEYYPETGKAVLYDNTAQTTKEVPVTGSISIPSGSYTATYSAEAQTQAPVRARLVFGFSGQVIGN